MGRKQGPSIWALSVLQRMMATGLFAKVEVAQARFGAANPKPTTLLVANVSESILLRLEELLRVTPLSMSSSIGLVLKEGQAGKQQP